MFEHPALDECSHFLKIDTDFFLDQNVEYKFRKLVYVNMNIILQFNN